MDICEGQESDKDVSQHSFYEATASRMVAMYKHVRKQQATMSERNRINRTKHARNVRYEVEDLVLLWEPAQVRYLSDKDVDSELRREQKDRLAPKKLSLIHI